jgi:hypothetical protein
MGDSTGARASLEAALALRLSIADADPGPRFQRDAALSLTAMAELEIAQGNPAAAEPLIADAATRYAQLAGAAPADTLALRDLSIAQNIHAATLMQLGRHSEAVTVATASLATADRLLQLGPDVPDHMHDRLVTLNRLGDAQAALGDNRSAIGTFRAMVDQGNRLLDVDPYSTPWANDLALALERLGHVQSVTGDVAAALKSHQDSLALRDWLVAQDPSNPLWYRNLAPQPGRRRRGPCRPQRLPDRACAPGGLPPHHARPRCRLSRRSLVQDRCRPRAGPDCGPAAGRQRPEPRSAGDPRRDAGSRHPAARLRGLDHRLPQDAGPAHGLLTACRAGQGLAMCGLCL